MFPANISFSDRRACTQIQFSNDKFKLDLRAISEEQCEEWSDFLKAKAALYSMDNLLSSIDDGLTFRTRTFESLLKIPVADQVSIVFMFHMMMIAALL